MVLSDPSQTGKPVVPVVGMVEMPAPFGCRFGVWGRAKMENENKSGRKVWVLMVLRMISLG